jgi:regulator of sirC expression with transglutaminase-like and TPR domain
MPTQPPSALSVAVAPPPLLVGTFERLATLSDDQIDVATGAALIARDVYASLDVPALLARLDEIAAPLVARGLAKMAPHEQATAIASRVYGELRFAGNEADYYDPKNSLLPDVLRRRLGIPISLALVFCEVARRAGVRARGVSFPGHFLVRVDEAASDATPVLVDPFFGGKILDRGALIRLLRRGTSPSTELTDEHLAPASSRAILVRMLINLKWIYVTRGDFARALLALDRIISLQPDSIPAIRERGMLAARLGAHEAAREDLSRLLELQPDGADAQTIRARLEEISSVRRALN